MALVSLGELLAPISAEEPSGPNLEYDPEFAKLERIALGKPEQMMGASLVPAEEPDWKTILRETQTLLGRTKDLRIAIHLTKSLLRLGGLVGFSEGVAVLRGLIDGYWDTLHPRLDPEDDNDPTMRMNALAALADGPTLTAVRTTPLVASRAVGKFSLREIAVSTGELPPSKDENPPTPATIEGAFDSIEADVLATTAAAARSALDDLGLIESLVTDRVGGSRAVNLSKLSDLLTVANKHLAAAMNRRAAAVPVPVDTGDGSAPTDSGGADPTAAPTTASRRSGMPGEVNSREDVVRALEQIIAYYQRHEPTSPVPLVVKRAKRMVGMSFIEIIKDVVPDAASQAELLRGHSDPGDGS
jgi:type VI secretion system protein ImpA